MLLPTSHCKQALNARRMRELLDASEFKAADVYIPMPYLELTSRRVLTMQVRTVRKGENCA